MSEIRKRGINWFLAWNYDSEEEKLNRYSVKGWRLVKAGYFHNVYEKEEKKYRYRIDYHKFALDEYEKERYIETFEEMGWHYVDGVNGWNYFEKEVKEEYTEEDYCIYTDNSSLKNNLLRWIRVARIIEIISICVCAMNFILILGGSKYNLFAMITNIIEIALLEFGIRSMKQKRIGVKRSYRSNIVIGNLLFFGMFAWFVINVAGVFGIPHNHVLLNTHFQGTFISEKPVERLSFLVEDSGSYDISADCTTDSGIIVLSIYEGNDRIYTTKGTTIAIDESLKLKDGIHYAEIVVDDLENKPTGNFYSVFLKID